MARLLCRCLNVAVHYKEEGRAVQGSMVVPVDHRLADQTLSEVEEDSPGLTTEQPELLRSVSAGDWEVQSCSNCGCDVAITHCQKTRLLICPGLLSSEEAVSQVRGHPHYSRVFRILLNPDLEEEAEGGSSRPRASSLSSSSRADPAMKRVHCQVRQFLAREEEELDQRVREFEKREKESFAKLQQKTFRQRTLLLAAIAKAKQRDSPPISHPHTLTHSTSNDQKQQVTITLHDPRPAPSNKVEDEGALFSLDGFDDEDDVDGGKGGVAFPQSDDEETGTDDSSYRDMSSVQAAIASSVPLSIPLFQPTETHQPEEVEPTDMASSIKALALSVQNTGVFGDLPRPRVNSAARYK